MNDYHSSLKIIQKIDSYSAIVRDARDYILYGFVCDVLADKTFDECKADDKPIHHTMPKTLDVLFAEIHYDRLCNFQKKHINGKSDETKKHVLMVVGEAPGYDKDVIERPFVGAAGQYIDKWLDAIDVSRYTNEIFSTTVSYRSQNAKDFEKECDECKVFLARHIALLKPICILVVGTTAARIVCAEDTALTLSCMRMKNGTYTYCNLSVFVTYHPSVVLQNTSLRRPVWDDLQMVKQYLESYFSSVLSVDVL